MSLLSRIFNTYSHAFLVIFAIVDIGCKDNNVPLEPVSRSGLDKRWNLDKRIQDHRKLISHAQSEANKLVLNCKSTFNFQVNDSDRSIVEEISKLPGVIKVIGSGIDRPKLRIIHLVSPDMPLKDDFFAFLKRMADGGVTHFQLDSLYEEYALQVKLMQIEHGVIIRCLVKNHGLRRIYAERSTEGDIVWTRGESDMPQGDSEMDRKENGQASAIGTSHWIGDLQSDFLDEFQNWHFKEIPHLEPVIAEVAFKKINNVSKLVQKRSVQRLIAEVQTILTEDSCCLIVGDDNDYTEALSRIGDDKLSYIRIETNSWQAISPLDPNIWGR